MNKLKRLINSDSVIINYIDLYNKLKDTPADTISKELLVFLKLSEWKENELNGQEQILHLDRL